MLNIGKNLKLPLEAATETFAYIGRRGSGKTNAACVLVEELFQARVQVVIMDPVGVWYGLKSGHTGASAGLAITVLGGEHADLPLNESSGAVVADFLVEHQISCVLDTSLFSKSAQRRFVADLLERIYRRKAEDRHKTPLHLVIEEADCFAPQRLFAGDERMFGSVDALVRRGRSRGVGVTLISQRPQVINKDVLSQVEVLACFQINSPQDRKAVDAWVEAHDIKGVRKEFMESLASLERGEAWFWSPGLLDIFKRVHVRARSTFDSSATPKVGEKRVEPKYLAKVDIEKLRAALSATVKEAEENDPRKLKTCIAELRQQVKLLQSKAPSSSVRELDDARKYGFDKGYEASRDAARSLVAVFTKELQHPLKALHDGVELYQHGLVVENPPRRSKAPTNLRDLPQFKVLDTRAEMVKAHASQSNGQKLPPVQRAFLSVLARHGACDRGKLALLSGYSPNSSTTGNCLSDLSKAGYITRGAGIEITDAGRDAVGPIDQLPEGEELVGYWDSQLTPCPRTLFGAMVRLHKGGARFFSKTAVAAEAEHKYSQGSSTFGNALSDLRKLGLIVGQKDELSLSPTMQEALS